MKLNAKYPTGNTPAAVEARRKYQKEWRESRKKMGIVPTVPGNEEPMSPWKKRSMAKQASQVRPMMLCGCPECGIEFFVKKNGEYAEAKFNSCPQCGTRYYKAGGQQ